MIRKLPISSFSTILVFVCLSLVGLGLIPLMPVKLSPSGSLPTVNVRFSLPDQSSKVVEMEVTSKLEAMLSRLEGIQSISSTSYNGGGNIQIGMDKHVDIDAARFEVATIIRQTRPSLPANTSYPSISLSKSDENANETFISFTVNAPSSLSEIYDFTDKHIKPKLATIKGVDRINVSGSMPMEYRLEYDAKQLDELGISYIDIHEAISNYLSKEFLGEGSVEQIAGHKSSIRVLLSTKNSVPSKLDCSAINVKMPSGKLICLNRLAKLNYQQAASTRIYRVNGLNSIYLSVNAKTTANQLSLSEKVKKEIEVVQSKLPPGYEIHTSYDATDYIREELSKIYFRLGLTLLILLLFVLLVYRSFKFLLLIISSLIINISVAVIIYYFLHLDIHLYSLAGITISITLIIDNVIVMSDQIMRRKNMAVFLAIAAGALTTMGALSMVFLMDDKIKLNLQDFVSVLMVNLFISLLVVLFVVPVLIDLFKIDSAVKSRPKRFLKKIAWARISIRIKRFYAKYCRFACRWKFILVILLVLSFGLPVFMLPEKVEGSEKWKELYNQSIGSEFYKQTVKPIVAKWLGGSLRLFVEKVYEGSYFTERKETTLSVSATLPNGSTLPQMDFLIQRMEAYLSQFKEIKQFQTNINSPYNANIDIQFTKQAERSSFPMSLKSNLISKALEMGGGSWSVNGIGDGFSNNFGEGAGSYYAELYGYNYDELTLWANHFKANLLKYKRIKEVTINSEFQYQKDDYQEFGFDLNKKALAEDDVEPIQLFASLDNMMASSVSVGQLLSKNGQEQIYLDSKQGKSYDSWNLSHIPLQANGNDFKLSAISTIEKQQAPYSIKKENQQYCLNAQFEYIGAGEQGQKVLREEVAAIQKQLPMGYTIENKSDMFSYWNSPDAKKPYGLLFLIFVLIFFMASILFNSLQQPFAILFEIPVSFIGIFLTFFLFGLNFDQGGFAAFVLLCGLTVNANIYIIDEYNRIRKQRNYTKLQAYVKAWHVKMRPILLTITSTSLGFLPFVLTADKEAFWFPLAAGTIGGLLFSLLGIVLFLPIFLKVSQKEISKSI